MAKYKNGWLLLLFILIGIVLGGLIADLTSGISALSWLGYGQAFGLDIDNPMSLDLGIIVIKFAMQIKITIASIIGVVAAIIIYKFI